MRDSVMSSLIEEAKKQGKEDADRVLGQGFDIWIHENMGDVWEGEPVELSEEEEDILWKAYQEGFGLSRE